MSEPTRTAAARMKRELRVERFVGLLLPVFTKVEGVDIGKRSVSCDITAAIDLAEAAADAMEARHQARMNAAPTSGEN